MPSKNNIADPPSRNDISAEFFPRATNVSPTAATLLFELVTRVIEDGETGLVTCQSVKKVKRNSAFVLGKLLQNNVNVACETTLYDAHVVVSALTHHLPQAPHAHDLKLRLCSLFLFDFHVVA